MNDELKKEILSLLESPELREYLMAPPEKLNCTQYAEIICGVPEAGAAAPAEGGSIRRRET